MGPFKFVSMEMIGNIIQEVYFSIAELTIVIIMSFLLAMAMNGEEITGS